MSKTSTETVRHALHGPTMGTRWSALFYAAPGLDIMPIQAALQLAVQRVDAQMSTWNPDSDLMRLNRVPIGQWVTIPADLARVLALGLDIGRASAGAFDIGMGDAVRAWGFGAQAAQEAAIRAALTTQRHAAHDLLELDGKRVRKQAPIYLDLNGIAKGYGVDQLALTLRRFGITAALVGIDGELRALGLRPDRQGWAVAVEAPDPDQRAPHSMLVLHDAAVATSGDYRHWVQVQDRRLSHTMDPRRGAPLPHPPASVTVIAPTCAQADAWATALMVAGPDTGMTLAAQHGLSALFLLRGKQHELSARACGALFSAHPGAVTQPA